MKLHLIILVFSFFLLSFPLQAQKEEKVVVITLDGLRWQELFGGADSLLINDKRFVENVNDLKAHFWAETKEERREKLFPFIWNFVAQEGMLLGNRWEGSKVNLSNSMVFSYPGYNEIFTGKADDEHINSNEKINNPNKTILEIANFSDKYQDKVLVFASWDVFPFILNEDRSNIPVNAGYRSSLSEKPSEKALFLDKIQKETPKRWSGVRFDVFTHNYAIEALQNDKPDILYIAYGETDDFAHDGRYDEYLKSANRTDNMIREVWEYINSDSYYKGQTSIFITTDHGRGAGVGANDTWRGHGTSIKDADQTWIMAFGNRIGSKGVLKENKQFYTSQFAPTLNGILELNIQFEEEHLPIFE